MRAEPLRLHLGCGGDPWDGWVNVDRVDLDGVDRVANFDEVPWPFEDASVDEAAALDLFEHIADPIAFMSELHRVLKPGAEVRIRTTHWQSKTAWTDPTHRRTATEETFDYWVPGTELNRRYGAMYAGSCLFERLGVTPSGGNLDFRLRRSDATAQAVEAQR